MPSTGRDDLTFSRRPPRWRNSPHPTGQARHRPTHGSTWADGDSVSKILSDVCRRPHWTVAADHLTWPRAQVFDGDERARDWTGTQHTQQHSTSSWPVCSLPLPVCGPLTRVSVAIVVYRGGCVSWLRHSMCVRHRWDSVTRTILCIFWCFVQCFDFSPGSGCIATSQGSFSWE